MDRPPPKTTTNTTTDHQSRSMPPPTRDSPVTKRSTPNSPTNQGNRSNENPAPNFTTQAQSAHRPKKYDRYLAPRYRKQNRHKFQYFENRDGEEYAYTSPSSSNQSDLKDKRENTDRSRLDHQKPRKVNTSSADVGDYPKADSNLHPANKNIHNSQRAASWTENIQTNNKNLQHYKQPAESQNAHIMQNQVTDTATLHEHNISHNLPNQLYVLPSCHTYQNFNYGQEQRPPLFQVNHYYPNVNYGQGQQSALSQNGDAQDQLSTDSKTLYGPNIFQNQQSPLPQAHTYQTLNYQPDQNPPLPQVMNLQHHYPFQESRNSHTMQDQVVYQPMTHTTTLHEHNISHNLPTQLYTLPSYNYGQGQQYSLAQANIYQNVSDAQNQLNKRRMTELIKILYQIEKQLLELKGSSRLYNADYVQNTADNTNPFNIAQNIDQLQSDESNTAHNINKVRHIWPPTSKQPFDKTVGANKTYKSNIPQNTNQFCTIWSPNPTQPFNTTRSPNFPYVPTIPEAVNTINSPNSHKNSQNDNAESDIQSQLNVLMKTGPNFMGHTNTNISENARARDNQLISIRIAKLQIQLLDIERRYLERWLKMTLRIKHDVARFPEGFSQNTNREALLHRLRMVVDHMIEYWMKLKTNSQQLNKLLLRQTETVVNLVKTSENNQHSTQPSQRTPPTTREDPGDGFYTHDQQAHPQNSDDPSLLIAQMLANILKPEADEEQISSQQNLKTEAENGNALRSDIYENRKFYRKKY